MKSVIRILNIRLAVSPLANYVRLPHRKRQHNATLQRLTKGIERTVKADDNMIVSVITECRYMFL